MPQAARVTTDTHWPGLAAMSPPDRRRGLALVRFDPWAGELALDNPLLFFLLVRAMTQFKLTLRKASLLSRLKRPLLLSLLGYAGSPSAVRFLRRCGFLRLYDPEFDMLKKLLARPLNPWSLHWRVPHLSLMTGMSEMNVPYAALAMDTILAEDGKARFPDGVQIQPVHLRGTCPDVLRKLIKDTADIARLIDFMTEVDAGAGPADAQTLHEIKLAQRRERVALSRCKSLEWLQWVHNDLADRDQQHWTKHVMEMVAGRIWPLPPLPGTDAIIPVSTPRMLIEEGYRMHHCIPTYVEHILDGDGYVYRVLEPERATVFIVPDPRKGFAVYEIRLVCNGEVSEETRKVVNAWLKASCRTQQT